ncbi:MAG: biosynthetic-type acetolactate synthase large subunit [Thermoguttaceae bacterium]
MSKTPQTPHALMSGAQIAIESLARAGVDTIFAYPGGFSMPLHQVLTQYRDKIRVILPRQEQGGGFAAHGYARSTGKLGVCMATSGPGATNLITTIADAKLDSIPVLFITGQVTTQAIGSDAFQETPIVELCRSITKSHYLVTAVEDVARIFKEAIYVATTGRPGPVLIDIPKNIQVTSCAPDFDVAISLPGYQVMPSTGATSSRGTSRKVKRELESSPRLNDPIAAVADAIAHASRPVIYAGGGIVASGASAALRELAEKCQIPVTTTLTGLSCFPGEHELSLGMIGMHGTAYANHAVSECDLLLAIGVRFDDRVTGNVAEFAKNARIIHVDIDPSEINKVKRVHLSIVTDANEFLFALNKVVKKPTNDLKPWFQRIAEWRSVMPLGFETYSDHIVPQQAIEMLWQMTRQQDCYIATGVGQHQMWTTQYYKFSKPRHWLSSAGLGTMGFGLPAAMGAKVAHPNATVIDIDGDGSFLMNIQEMATCHCEKIPVKVMLLNNQHLGMVVQWEDRFNQANRAHTYLGPIDAPEWLGKGAGVSPTVRFPHFVEIARGFGWDALEVSKPSELPAGIEAMLKSDKPFLLDVAVSYREHVLPMTPPGGTVRDMILR